MFIIHNIMDYKASIYEKITQFTQSSSDEAIQDFYYKIVDLMQERDNDSIYLEIIKTDIPKAEKVI